MSTLTVEDTVNPLVKIIKANLVQQVPKEYLPQLRKLIKKTCVSHDFYAGAMSFNHHLDIKIYMKRRIKPAWQPDLESDDQGKS